MDEPSTSRSRPAPSHPGGAANLPGRATFVRDSREKWEAKRPKSYSAPSDLHRHEDRAGLLLRLGDVERLVDPVDR
jgi:hypothetical protein